MANEGSVKLYPTLPSCNRGDLYTKTSPIGVTNEVGDLLYGLVRVAKPIFCVETGTEHACSALRIGQALKENGIGQLHTADIDLDLVANARLKLEGLPVTVHHTMGVQLINETTLPINFIFIDSGGGPERHKELELLEGKIAPGGIVAWHDACVGYPDLYEYFSQKYDWPHLIFPSIVGTAVFQRPE